MSATATQRRGRMPYAGPLSRAFAAMCCGAMLAAAQGADDPYLQMLDKEVTKVESNPTDTAGKGAAVDGGAGNDSAVAPSREHFETLLREQHVGTYSFYRRLPERSREEVFRDYSRGASMEALREKIIDRYLHP